MSLAAGIAIGMAIRGSQVAQMRQQEQERQQAEEKRQQEQERLRDQKAAQEKSDINLFSLNIESQQEAKKLSAQRSLEMAYMRLGRNPPGTVDWNDWNV